MKNFTCLNTIHKYSKQHFTRNFYSKIIVLFFLFSNLILGVEQEWLMQIVYAGAGPVSATVMLYSGSTLIAQGSCSGGLPWTFNPQDPDYQANFGTDVNAEVGGQSSHNANSTFSINIEPGNYLVRIISGTRDKYFFINIPEAPGSGGGWTHY